MRVFLAMAGAVGALLLTTPGPAVAASKTAPIAAKKAPRNQPVRARSASAQSTLRGALASGLQAAGGASGALVVDLDTGRTLFSSAADVPRMPASVEKLYTTSTALLRFGPTGTLNTDVFGKGSVDTSGAWHGTLYLKGGGDPSFGSSTFDSYAYGRGTGATMQRLVANLIRQTGITSVRGPVVGDESYFDSLRGTPPYGFQFSTDVEGLLSGLIYDRGLANEQGTAYQVHPAKFAAQQFIAALRSAGVKVPSKTPVYTYPTPSTARQLTTVHSPSIATLIRLTNTPSDNFFAEMLLKGIGARFSSGGTTAAGAAVVRAQVARSFGIHPRLEDGSGLSRYDRTTPRQVVKLLSKLATNRPFVGSLSIAGLTGTMQYGLAGTAAQGRCEGKTGTLNDVANLVGYCTARDHHTLAFAFLMNSVDPTTGHALEDQMAVAVAKYNG